MGLIRFILAVAVVIAHTGPIYGFSMLPGNYAVETFFMISGFYMSLVLSDKYNLPSSVSVFYTNRFIRLYPTYISVVVLAWLWFFFTWFWIGKVPANSWIEYYDIISAFPKFLIIFANWTMIGLDIPSLFHFSKENGFMVFHYYGASTAPDGAAWVGDFRTIGQAWSIGLEIWFYILAPFIVRLSNIKLLLLTILSVAVKIAMEMNGFLTYFFFPAQLCFFLIGIFCHRFYKSNSVFLAKNQLGLIFLIIDILFTCFYMYFDFYGIRYAYYTVVSLSLPFVFYYFRKNSWDRWIGNLSYPIYMSHMVVISVSHHIFRGGASGIFALLLTIVFSSLILKYFEDPLDEWRQKRVKSKISNGNMTDPATA